MSNMLSGMRSQSSNALHDYHDYANHPSSSSIATKQSNLYAPTNLQAGRKRSESELESNNLDSVDSGGVRRRISRACDQCNQLRTKCDGKHPCAHCTDAGLHCEYARVHKKRGRAPKKEHEQSKPEDLNNFSAENHQQSNDALANTQQVTSALRDFSNAGTYSGRNSVADNAMPPSSSQANGTFDASQQNTYYNSYNTTSNPTMNVSAQMQDPLVSQITQQQYNVPDASTFAAPSLDPSGMQQGFGFPLGDDYSVAFMGKAPMVESPDWMALTTPMFITEQPPTTQPRPPDTLRYPVLRPLLPHIDSIMPQSLACDLLEQYFASTTSAYLRPASPYVLGYIFRKKSLLHPTEPRQCTPALLASMLWISAQTSDHAFLTSQIDSRAKVCQKLLELTINMLKPLVHNSSSVVVGSAGYASGTQTDAGLGGLIASTEHGNVGTTDRAQIDNLATYIHLATVVSASERKAASLRWWNAAWSLARELRLGRELPPNETQQEEDQPNSSGQDERRRSSFTNTRVDTRKNAGYMSEEEREERRRTWWLLYMQDRHLALCYNRPMFFLNKECENLLQPLDDDVWQAGRLDRIDASSRKRGLNIECTSHSVFGYFLPLMVLLGEILDLNHARNRPRFGPKANQPRNWDETTEEITEQLEIYERSLKEFESSGGHHADYNHNEAITPSVASGGTADTQYTSELALQTQTVVAYGTHIVHVLHVLLTGKWDPIALLDDNDLWISSQSFVTATGHAVSAAEAVAEIIEHDPDLSFMPFFFGVYLLQGSFLLLLFADKLQGDVSPDVVRACELICRAHEACVATLDTQYQRNFRKVMRSALQQVRGRIQEDPTEQQNWRREVLKLYRWTGDGTGLAL